MARRGFTPGGGSARSSLVQRPEPDACVVYYQHPYPLKASFLHLAQQRHSAFASPHVHAIGRKFCAVKPLTRKTAVPRITPVRDLDLSRSGSRRPAWRASFVYSSFAAGRPGSGSRPDSRPDSRPRSRPFNSASANPAPPAINTARHGYRFTSSFACTALRPQSSMACAVTRVAAVSARASLRLRVNAVLSADTRWRACCVKCCERSARRSMDARACPGTTVKAFVVPGLFASASLRPAPGTVEPASIEPILARLPGGTRELCCPHAPRGSCKRARAAENSAPSSRTAAEKYSHISSTASEPAAPNEFAVPACVR